MLMWKLSEIKIGIDGDVHAKCVPQANAAIVAGKDEVKLVTIFFVAVDTYMYKY